MTSRREEDAMSKMYDGLVEAGTANALHQADEDAESLAGLIEASDHRTSEAPAAAPEERPGISIDC